VIINNFTNINPPTPPPKKTTNKNKTNKTNNQLSSQIIQHTVKPALRGHDLWYKEKVAL
jgi:hypothetical protein